MRASGRALTTIGVCLLVTLGTSHGQTGSGPVTFRFHHLHYRVADPGEALGEAADRLKGTRTIAQGLGVGIRVGREYLLFDRDSSDDAVPGRMARAVGTAAERYTEAMDWLRGLGAVVQPDSLEKTSIARGLPIGALDHVAFAADDLTTAVAALREKPASATADAARYRLRTGLIVEIVRDTDRPDAYWCPMHPDVRSPGGGKCPRCGMAFVVIPPPRIGEYKMDVAISPRPGGGASGIQLVVRDPETGDPVTGFLDVHERPFHLFIISRDLTMFAHEHPVRREDGSFQLTRDLAPGEYTLLADFLPAGGTSQLVQRAIVTPGYTGPLFVPAADPALALEQTADGLRIRLESGKLQPRRESILRFVVSDAQSGLPVTDLEPYLGAAGHLLIVSSDLTTAIHGHPESVPTGGPDVMFGPVFPSPGLYKMWFQFQRNGRVVTSAFAVTVPEK